MQEDAAKPAAAKPAVPRQIMPRSLWQTKTEHSRPCHCDIRVATSIYDALFDWDPLLLNPLKSLQLFQSPIFWKYLLFVLLDFVYCASSQSLTYSLPQIAWYWNFTHDMIWSFQYIWTSSNNKYQRNPVINFEKRFGNSSTVVSY